MEPQRGYHPPKQQTVSTESFQITEMFRVGILCPKYNPVSKRIDGIWTRLHSPQKIIAPITAYRIKPMDREEVRQTLQEHHTGTEIGSSIAFSV